MDTIVPGALVALQVRLFDAQGHLLEATGEPLAYVHGERDILPRIEQALDGQAVGYRASLLLEPEDAFGDDDPLLLHVVPLALLGTDSRVGLQVEGVPGQPSDGRIYTITGIASEVAVLDGNHPLAGRALRFDVEVVDVRMLTAAELAQVRTEPVTSLLRVVPAHAVHPPGAQRH